MGSYFSEKSGVKGGKDTEKVWGVEVTESKDGERSSNVKCQVKLSSLRQYQ